MSAHVESESGRRSHDGAGALAAGVTWGVPDRRGKPSGPPAYGTGLCAMWRAPDCTGATFALSAMNRIR